MILAEKIANVLVKVFGSRNERLVSSMLETVREVNALEPQMQRLSDAELRRKTDEFKDRLSHGEVLDDLLPEAFATAREASRRVILTPDLETAQPMRHFDVQIVGGIALHQGMIAEMVTGEGKTLVANLAAYLNALLGRGVHIVTVNDYLARRDRDWMGPMYEFLGLTAGVIQNDQDYEEKKTAYGCDVTFGTHSEFGFDYLRDNMRSEPEEQVQKERYFAIVDEVDNVLIDEARTPLIISGAAEESTEKYYRADRVARRLKRDVHFIVKEKEETVHLTEEGIARVENLLGVDSIYAGRNTDWPHHMEQALRAHHLYKRDVKYVVKGGEIMIVDTFTGRLMHGRRWSDGLHQAVEAKERLRIKEENQTLATITYQNFFRLYEKLAGMTGTAMTEATEFDKIYKLDVVNIPTNQPLIRIEHRDVVFRTEPEKFNAIEEEIVQQHATGRPMLVGTIAIETSEMLGQRLKQRGIPHEILNAKHHEREAQIVAKAGQMGNVTIATNMAGRGTDIVLGTFTEQELLEHWQTWGLAPKDVKITMPRDQLERRLTDFWIQAFLDEETLENTPEEKWIAKLHEHWRRSGICPLHLCTSVAELGGLHIVGTERHEARRIDNQLRGRAGRQGDPGSSRFFLSLQDDLMRIFAPERVGAILQRVGMEEGMAIESGIVTRSIRRAQKRVEERNFEMRKHVLEYDEVMNEQRKAVYGRRQQVIEKGDLKRMIVDMIDDCLYTEIERDVSSEAPPADRNCRPLVEWARRFDVELSPEEWAQNDYERVRGLFADRASAATAERDQLARRCVSDAADLHLSHEVPFPGWDLRAFSRWARKLGLAVEAEDLAVLFKQAVQDHYVEKAAVQFTAENGEAEQGMKESLAEICTNHAVDTYLGSYLAVEEWDFRGLAAWGSAMDLSMPVSQWQRTETEEDEAADDVRARREELRKWLTERITVAFRSRDTQRIAADLVKSGIDYFMAQIEQDAETGLAPLAKWLSRTAELPASEGEIETIVSGRRTELIERLARQLVQKRRKHGGATRGWLAHAFDTFMTIDLAAPERNFIALAQFVDRKFGVHVHPFNLSKHEAGDIQDLLTRKIQATYDAREEEVGPDMMRTIEKLVLLQKIDTKWKDHLYAMDHLKSGIGMRGYAQVDPKVEYTREARQMFDQMMESVREEVTDLILRVQFGRDDEGPPRADIWGGAQAYHPDVTDDSIQDQQEAAIAGTQTAEKAQPIRTYVRVGRNDPCPCGSGKKFKKCCGKAG